MRVLIDLSEETLAKIEKMAEIKGVSRKKFIEDWCLQRTESLTKHRQKLEELDKLQKSIKEAQDKVASLQKKLVREVNNIL